MSLGEVKGRPVKRVNLTQQEWPEIPEESLVEKRQSFQIVETNPNKDRTRVGKSVCPRIFQFDREEIAKLRENKLSGDVIEKLTEKVEQRLSAWLAKHFGNECSPDLYRNVRTAVVSAILQDFANNPKPYLK